MTKEQVKEKYSHVDEIRDFCSLIEDLQLYPDLIPYTLIKLKQLGVIEEIPELYVAQVQKRGVWVDSFYCKKIFKDTYSLIEYTRTLPEPGDEFALRMRPRKLN